MWREPEDCRTRFGIRIRGRTSGDSNSDRARDEAGNLYGGSIEEETVDLVRRQCRDVRRLDWLVWEGSGECLYPVLVPRAISRS